MADFEGTMLNVNLSNCTIKKSKIDKDIVRKFIGGSGLAAKLFFDRVSPDVDPLSPDNVLFVMTGPVSGINFPGAARFSVCSKSPLTNIWGESNCGGNFAHALRSAGHDVIAIEGASPKPVYLSINDDQVEIKDAADLWGKDTYETVDTINEHAAGKGKPSIIAIGQAGENLVKYALVNNDKSNVAGRAGMGTVMGAKKLKAIAVRGTGKVEAALPEEYDKKRKELVAKSKESIITEYLKAQGTGAAMNSVGVLTGDLVGKNWSLGDNSAVASKTGGDVMAEKYLTRPLSCYGCHVGCKRMVKVSEGPYRVEEGAGPEYEGLASFGTLLMIDDLAAIIKLNESCNKYGLDVISCGSSIAFAIDCLENGLISLDDTDGIALGWGKIDAVIEMVDKIAKRDGFGDLLAEGTKRAAAKIGKNAADYTVEVKGLEVPLHDPRAYHGFGLAFATATRGACHVNDMTWTNEQGFSVFPEIGLTGGYQAQVSEGKAELVRISQDLGMVVNSAPLCIAIMGIWSTDDWVDMIRITSGFDYDVNELMECGERIWLLKRGLDNLMGVTTADDRLPKKIMIPLKEGPAAGSVPNLELMLKEYYQLRGLDANGRPLKEKLHSLGLSDLADKLYYGP